MSILGFLSTNLTYFRHQLLLPFKSKIPPKARLKIPPKAGVEDPAISGVEDSAISGRNLNHYTCIFQKSKNNLFKKASLRSLVNDTVKKEE